MKSSYNERFLFSDPLSKTSASRVTRYRAKRLKEDHVAIIGASQYQYSEESVPFDSLNVSSDKIDSKNSIVPASFLVENSSSDHDVTMLASLDPNTHPNYDVCSIACEELDIMNHPQSLELSDLVLLPDNTDLDIEEDEGDDDDELANEITNNESRLIEHDQHELLYKEAMIKTSASSVLIMKYAMKHKLTREAIADLLQIVKLHCPSPNNIPSSLFHFKKQFKDFQYPIKYHYFCNTCLSEVPKSGEFCTNHDCNHSFAETNSLSSFIELPIGLQLKTIL